MFLCLLFYFEWPSPKSFSFYLHHSREKKNNTMSRFCFSLVCDPHYFGLRLEGDSIHVKEDFNSLVVIPLHNDPLNFKIGELLFHLK